MDDAPSRISVLVCEPWYDESHRKLVDGLVEHSRHDVRTAVLPRARWRWRMRWGALALAGAVRAELARGLPDVLFVTDYVNLPDLLALVPELAPVPRVVYFLEDQVTYPVREGREREFEFIAINFMTAHVANACVFCSEDQRRRFVDGLVDFARRSPDGPSGEVVRAIAEKSRVIPIGVDLSPFDRAREAAAPKSGPLRLVWPHRFEHDKGPDEFFRVLFALADEGLDFRVSAVGRRYRDVPPIFREAESRLAGRIVHWGFLEGDAYAAALAAADVVVSTALQETQGLAVIEAIRAGCEPLLPNRLSYPEILGDDAATHTYSSEGDLRRWLRRMMRHPEKVRAWPSHAERMGRFGWRNVIEQYDELVEGVAQRVPYTP